MTTVWRSLVLMALGWSLALPLGAQETPTTAKAAFEKIKSLAGEWQGSVTEPDGPATQVRYRVTSGGSAVFETQFPGSDHEMISAYHLDGDRLVVTHYCAMGNQPRMVLNPEESTSRKLVFDFDGGSNLDPAQDTHVHSGQIAFTGAQQIEAEWEVYQGSRQTGSNRFFLSRKTP